MADANTKTSEIDKSASNAPAEKFISHSATAEDLFKSQTVGLVKLSDFRKRRAQVLEQKEREVQEQSLNRLRVEGSNSNPAGRLTAPRHDQRKKQKLRARTKGKLSFENDDGEDEASPTSEISTTSALRSAIPDSTVGISVNKSTPAVREVTRGDKRSTPGGAAPKLVTKAALLKEAQTREQLRRDFILLQESVKSTEIAIPFVFYDGTNTPGGVCTVKKGDHIWLFLDKARKVGAEMGASGGGDKISRREWARVGVDDLMVVRGETIIPHHYEVYYFIMNKCKGPNGELLFDFSAQLPSAGDQAISSAHTRHFNPLSRPGEHKTRADEWMASLSNLEGADRDATYTKVVDRRWYERNKHIFPASVWEEFDPEKDYSNVTRTDKSGNMFFFG